MDHNPFNSDGENPFGDLLGALLGAMGGNGHSDSSEHDFSDNEEFQALMAGDPEQLARCANCPVKQMCGIYAAYLKAQQTANTTNPGLTAAKVAEILEDRRVKSSLRKSIDLGVYNALNENDFLEHAIVVGLLKYDEYRRHAKKEAARKFWGKVWKIVTFPIKAFALIIASPFILLFTLFAILVEAFTWRIADARIEAELADTKAGFADDDWFSTDEIAEILEGERNAMLADFTFIERWGYKLGRWVYTKTHRQPQATPAAADTAVEEQPVQPAAEVDLTEAASAGNEDLLNKE